MNQAELISKFPGIKYCIGLDECGWGASSGTCTLGLTVLPIESKLKVKDSKKYSSHEARQKDISKIKDEVILYRIIDISPKTINDLGLGPAKNKATIDLLEEVLLQFDCHDILVIIDGGFIPNLPASLSKYTILAIPKADENITACSAASVLAKTHRDQYMIELSKDPKYSMYEFDKNKGYITAEHKAALKQYGISDQHRLIRPVKEIIKWREKQSLMKTKT